MKTRTHKLIPLASITGIALTLATTQSQAASVLIDIGINTQQTSVTGWNNLTAGTGGTPANLTDLVNSSGASTGLTLDYFAAASNVGIAGTGANYGGPYPAALSAIPASALRDGLFLNTGTVNLTLGGLNPLLTYDFTLYGARGNNGGDAIYTATGANSASGSISTILNNSDEIVSLSGIIPNSENEIVIVVSRVDEDQTTALNFIQIDAIPEPSTALLGGLGLLALLRRRRN